MYLFCGNNKLGMARKYHQRHRERQRQHHRNREVQNRFQALQPVKAAVVSEKYF